MLLGSWGERAGGLLGRMAERSEVPLERAGSTVVLGAAGATAGGWRCWVSGRIENAAELAERFPGPADAGQPALVARLHAQVGPAAIDLLRGAFVVVSADLERDRALVARDHLGGRPLVYAHSGDGALFAEHEREVVAALPASPGPDRIALAQWIQRLGLPPGRTLFEGVNQLPAAHRLVLGGGGVVVERFWAPRFEATVPDTREDVGERLREAAFDAVERAAAGSRRTAVRLSGGLDSATVAAALADRPRSGREAVALSAVFPDNPETDESELIVATAARTGLPVELLRRDDDGSLLAPALRHIDRWHLPPATHNLFVWEPVMARARALGVDAMLDGEGGDELFGLAPYLIADRLRVGRVLSAWSLAGRIPGVGEAPAARVRLRALRIFGVGALAPEWLKRLRRHGGDGGAATGLARPEDLAALAALRDGSGIELDGPLWWRDLARDLTSGRELLGVSAHLRRGEVTDGVERRHPFLFDRTLVETVLGNPPELQFDPTRDRVLLREALAGRIPDRVRLHYSKSDFTPLLVAALSGPEGGRLEAALSRPDAPVREFLREGALDELLRGGAGPKPKRLAFRLWQVGMADAWLRALQGLEGEVLEKSA